jgi:hypothetical protein
MAKHDGAAQIRGCLEHPMVTELAPPGLRVVFADNLAGGERFRTHPERPEVYLNAALPDTHQVAALLAALECRRSLAATRPVPARLRLVTAADIPAQRAAPPRRGLAWWLLGVGPRFPSRAT